MYYQQLDFHYQHYSYKINKMIQGNFDQPKMMLCHLHTHKKTNHIDRFVDNFGN
tara:strand:- start:50 stop:211 length:162 start_codon:yes stop_codon:yes gene_type:complete